ncbi:MAG: M1 family aminopeptidase, partial [Saprospiraceae bacterium]
RTSAAQLVAHSFFYFYTILRKPSFWAIVICGIVTILVNSVNLGLTYGVPSFPVTYLLLDELKEMSIFFFFILLGLFTSDVIWRERRYGVDQVVDALPVSDLVMVGGKFFGLVATYLVLLVSMLIFGMILQIASGFYDFQFATYLLGLGELWLMLMLFTFISFFFQVVSNSQFIGHVLLVVFFIFVGLLGLKGFNHGLYDFGGPGLSDYSELNGFGHSFYPFVFFKSYWISFCIGVLAITAALNPRGLNVSLKARVLAMSYRLTPAVKGVLGFASFSMLLLGVFIFYNTNVLNEYYSNSSKVELRAEYEKVLKHLQYIPQPKITDVSLTLDIFPEALGFELGGKYVLKNLDSVLIEAIHVQTFVDAVDTLKGISFNRNALVSESYDQFGYRIYQLEQPLAPGDSLEMSFSQALSPKGFAPNHRSSAVVYNGSLIDNDKFPSIGYCNQIELEEQSIRADYGLDSVVQKEDRGHPFESHYGRDGGDGSSIDFKITVSTSVDQVAVAPGALKRDWIDGERRFFEYQMDAPMINFYAITSARYAVKKRQWSASKLSDSEPVDLAVYYHPSHAYNVDRMMDGLSAGLTYCTEAFGPYPYGSLKVVEVPRDADRAQSFPTLITYSESMGFIMDVDSTVDLNIPFFITAHEVAHQWWGMQLVAANVKGKHFLLESLSHYSALMTYQATYGAEETRRLVDFERGRYVAGNQEDLTPEVALIDVTDQEYLYYSKASVLLYEFQEKIGEEALNGALQAFICDWNAAKRIQARKRFAYSVDLLPYLKANAPVRMQEEIVEMFEEVSEMTLD